jgi:hypothetical protein
MQGAVSLSAEANKVQRVCAKCGATVFADSPRGFCSVCLFKTGLGQLEGDCSGEQEQSRIQGVGVTANILSKVTLDGSIRYWRSSLTRSWPMLFRFAFATIPRISCDHSLFPLASVVLAGAFAAFISLIFR